PQEYDARADSAFGAGHADYPSGAPVYATGEKLGAVSDRQDKDDFLLVHKGRLFGLDALPARTKAPLSVPTLASLYGRHVRAIYRFIYSKVGNREEAEDLTSQVFLRAARGINSTCDALSALGWLFQVARTIVADHLRSLYQLRANSLDDLLDPE